MHSVAPKIPYEGRPSRRTSHATSPRDDEVGLFLYGGVLGAERGTGHINLRVEESRALTPPFNYPAIQFHTRPRCQASPHSPLESLSITDTTTQLGSSAPRRLLGSPERTVGEARAR